MQTKDCKLEKRVKKAKSLKGTVPENQSNAKCIGPKAIMQPKII